MSNSEAPKEWTAKEMEAELRKRGVAYARVGFGLNTGCYVAAKRTMRRSGDIMEERAYGETLDIAFTNLINRLDFLANGAPPVTSDRLRTEVREEVDHMVATASRTEPRGSLFPKPWPPK